MGVMKRKVGVGAVWRTGGTLYGFYLDFFGVMLSRGWPR